MNSSYSDVIYNMNKMLSQSINDFRDTLARDSDEILIIGAVFLIMGFAIIYKCMFYHSPAKSIDDPEKDNLNTVVSSSKATSYHPITHSQFNPKLIERDVPLPSHPNLNHLSTVHAISITKPERNDVNSHMMSKLMSNDFTALSSMLINVGLLSSKKQNPITKYHSATNNTLRMIDAEWQPIHENSLEITIKLIKEAIAQNYNNIIITYNYDGIWAYAAGYWNAKNDPVVNNYVNDLEALSHQINIYFSKLTPEHTNDSIVNKLIKKVDKL